MRLIDLVSDTTQRDIQRKLERLNKALRSDSDSYRMLAEDVTYIDCFLSHDVDCQRFTSELISKMDIEQLEELRDEVNSRIARLISGPKVEIWGVECRNYYDSWHPNKELAFKRCFELMEQERKKESPSGAFKVGLDAKVITISELKKYGLKESDFSEADKFEDDELD